jgi:hypothetical protein
MKGGCVCTYKRATFLRRTSPLDCTVYGIYSLTNLLMLIISIILAINRHDTLRPLNIYFRLLTNNVHDTKYHKWCSTITSLESSHVPGKYCILAMTWFVLFIFPLPNLFSIEVGTLLKESSFLGLNQESMFFSTSHSTWISLHIVPKSSHQHGFLCLCIMLFYHDPNLDIEYN